MNQRWDVFRYNSSETSAAKSVDQKPEYNYVLFKAFYQNVDYLKAEEHCRVFDAHLASFHTKEEFGFIQEMVKRYYGWAYSDFWLGLFHRGELLPGLPNHRLYFLDGSTYNLSEFSSDEQHHANFWGRHMDQWNSYRYEPDHYVQMSPLYLSSTNNRSATSEHCISLSQADYKLYDHNCARLASFICRYDPVKETSSQEAKHMRSERQSIHLLSENLSHMAEPNKSKAMALTAPTDIHVELDSTAVEIQQNTSVVDIFAVSNTTLDEHATNDTRTDKFDMGDIDTPNHEKSERNSTQLCLQTVLDPQVVYWMKQLQDSDINIAQLTFVLVAVCAVLSLVLLILIVCGSCVFVAFFIFAKRFIRYESRRSGSYTLPNRVMV
ncbi:lectin c-type domain-containing protein [Ditylenchus destructor]|nr:lectin c-type domain-containing protein [Ditylenchus destructor]